MKDVERCRRIKEHGYGTYSLLDILKHAGDCGHDADCTQALVLYRSS